MNSTETQACPRVYTRCPACHNDTLTVNKGRLVEAAKEWRKAEKRHALMELGELGGDSGEAKSIAERKLHAVRIAADKCETMPNSEFP